MQRRQPGSSERIGKCQTALKITTECIKDCLIGTATQRDRTMTTMVSELIQPSPNYRITIYYRDQAHQVKEEEL